MALPPIRIRITGDNSELKSALDKSGLNLSSFAARAGQILRRVTMAFAALSAGAVAALSAMARSSLSLIDEQSKLARQLGGTTIAIQTLQRAADLSGVSLGTLTQGASRLQQTLGEVERKGAGPAFEALERLKLSASSLIAMDVDKRFEAIAKAIQTQGFNAAQTADILRQLGMRQGEMTRILENGAAAITLAREEVKLFGVAVNDIDARAIEAANDAWSTFSLALRGVANQIAVEIAPYLQAIADRFKDIVQEAGGIGNVVRPAFEGLHRAIKFASDNANILRNVFIAIIGLKVAAFVAGAGLAFVSLARAVGTARLALISFQYVVAAATGPKGLLLLTGMLTGAAVASGAAEKAFNALGIKTDALTKDLHEFANGATVADKALSRLAGNTAFLQNQTFNTVNGYKALIEEMKKFNQVVPEKPSGGGGGAGGGGGGAKTVDPSVAEEERLREQIQRRLEIIREGMMTEKELRAHDLEEKIQLVKDAHEKEIINEIDRNAMIEQLRKQHGDRMARIQDAVNMRALRATADTFGALAQASQAGGERLVKITQALGIAQALINAYVGATEALKMQFPLNIAAFAKVLATGLAAVAKIRSVGTKGGGGGGGGIAAGGAAIGGGGGGGGGRDTNQGGEGRAVYVRIQGEMFGREQVRSLVEKISEYQQDGGGRVVIA